MFNNETNEYVRITPREYGNAIESHRQAVIKAVEPLYTTSADIAMTANAEPNQYVSVDATVTPTATASSEHGAENASSRQLRRR